MSPAAQRGRTLSRRLSAARRRPYGRCRRRGVSDIIATIFLVVITVVLAAVLFVEVIGLTHTGESSPYEVGMVFSTETGAASTYFDLGILAVTSGLTTSMFGLHVSTPAGSTYGIAAAPPGACEYSTASPSPGTCTGVSNSWYGVLVGGMGRNVTATYSALGWVYVSDTTDIALNDGYALIIVTPLPVSGLGYVINAFSTGSTSVSGTASL